MGILIRAEHALFALLWSFSSESYSYRVILSPCVFRDSKDNFLSTFHSFIRTLQVWNSAKFEPSIQTIYLILCEGGFSLVCRNSAVSSQQSKITNSKGTYVKPSEKCYINIFFFYKFATIYWIVHNPKCKILHIDNKNKLLFVSGKTKFISWFLLRLVNKNQIDNVTVCIVYIRTKSYVMIVTYL